MHFLGWLVWGVVIGAIARLLMPGKQPMGIIMTMLLGIAGSFVGGFIGSTLSGQPMDWSNPAGWLGAILGSLLLLFIFGFTARRTV